MWFDGEVQLLTWYNGDLLDLDMVDIIEYHYLGSICSQQSKYHCLADWLAKIDPESYLSQFDFCTSEDNLDKYASEMCSPISLPFSSSKIPICDLNITFNSQ